MALRFLFLSYWGIADGLTAATVRPHVEILSQFSGTSEILLVTIEREKAGPAPQPGWLPCKTRHVSLSSLPIAPRLLAKTHDFTLFPLRVAQLARRHRSDVILARSSLAGSIAMAASEIVKRPFYVESFEPHSDYAADAGAWSRRGLPYRFQHAMERAQSRRAAGIMPVSYAYAAYLAAHGVPPSRLRTVPCGVDFDRFRFDPHARALFRRRLGLDDGALAGIYVGKFGGLYLDHEAFEAFAGARRHLGDRFRLIILTPQDPAWVWERLRRHGAENCTVFVGGVSHDEVPGFLSGSDFGFVLCRGLPSQRFVSSVKVGEYWANGLPVVLTEGVGDDQEIVENERAGGVFHPGRADLQLALNRVVSLAEHPDSRSRIASLAKRYRSWDRVREAYRYFFFDGAPGTCNA
jgi:glycosyltransferase involved in cell wall biosynthesis